MTKTPQIEALPGMTPLGMAKPKTKVPSFKTLQRGLDRYAVELGPWHGNGGPTVILACGFIAGG